VCTVIVYVSLPTVKTHKQLQYTLLPTTLVVQVERSVRCVRVFVR